MLDAEAGEEKLSRDFNPKTPILVDSLVVTVSTNHGFLVKMELTQAGGEHQQSPPTSRS